MGSLRTVLIAATKVPALTDKTLLNSSLAGTPGHPRLRHSGNKTKNCSKTWRSWTTRLIRPQKRRPFRGQPEAQPHKRSHVHYIAQHECYNIGQCTTAVASTNTTSSREVAKLPRFGKGLSRIPSLLSCRLLYCWHESPIPDPITASARPCRQQWHQPTCKLEKTP